MTMKLSPLVTVLLMIISQHAFSQNVSLLTQGQSPQINYAAGVLRKSLVANKYILKEGLTEYTIRLVVDDKRMSSESYSITIAGKTITITGGDDRGILYGSLALTEELNSGIALQKIKASSEQPKLPFRAIKFNLPWNAYREGLAMELHLETCRDTLYWRSFLDMMAENRFNTLTLWNLHPFPFMMRAKNFPKASPFSDSELLEWQNLYHAIFRMAKERGIDSYLINWNIFVTPEFAKAYGGTFKNTVHFGDGDTSDIVKRYTRESITQVLEEYPDLTGIGFTEGEAMNGMTPLQRQQWVDETIIEGMRNAKRSSRLIFRVPLSAGVSDGGSTSVGTEQLTRKAMEGYHFLDGPVWVELKFNWSHGHSTTKLLKVHGGKLNDTYFNPVPQNYRITWTVRNEDFFCLRWGQPDFIRDHIAANTQPYVGGYLVGSEGYIPAKDYFTKTGNVVDWKYAFERQWLFYKLWGRLLYNPSTPDQVFRDAFVQRYGKSTGILLDAYSLVSKTPLRLASLFDFTWDFSLYSEGFMSMNKQNMEYISTDRLINQPVADPDYVSVSNYVKAISTGNRFEKNKITPPILADRLQKDCSKALQLINIINAVSRGLQYELTDIKIWANIGLHFSEKLKGAVALQTYRLKGGEVNKQNAVRCLENSLKYWDAVVALTSSLYNEMPLAAYSYPHGGDRSLVNTKLRFHWSNLRADVAKDVEIERSARANSISEVLTGKDVNK